jgi:hypothetical protein
MTASSPRDRAEVAFGHMQRAASEVIAAVREGLDLLDDAVTNADVGEILDTFTHLSQTVIKKSRPAPGPPGTGARPARPQSPVQRISVR